MHLISTIFPSFPEFSEHSRTFSSQLHCSRGTLSSALFSYKWKESLWKCFVHITNGERLKINIPLKINSGLITSFENIIKSVSVTVSWAFSLETLATILFYPSKKKREKRGRKYSSVRATKCTRHHPSRSFYGLALSRRAFSPALELVEHHKTLDECERVSRFPAFIPLFLWSPSALIALSSPPRNLAFFFAGFHDAQVATPQRPSSPTRVVAEGIRQGGCRAGGELAVTFVTFSLLRFSSWFAF